MARSKRTAPAALPYLAELKRRAKESRIYRKYQLLGLAIAEALRDERHKSLYIKLAKERGGERLLALAKDVAERRGVKNRGAYFMALVAREVPPPQVAAPRAPRQVRPRRRSTPRDSRRTHADGKRNSSR